MAQDTDCCQAPPADGGAFPLLGLPEELLRIVAADPVLTNRDRKQARLACRPLEGAMTPVVFRRLVISRLMADFHTFKMVVTTPHLASCVEEVVWSELGCDGQDLEALPNLEGYEDLRAHLLTAARELCWLPRSRGPGVEEFLEIFNNIIASMPRVRSFSSEPMRWDRVLCTQPDMYPLDVGVVTTHIPLKTKAWTQGFMRFLLPTMSKNPGRITRLRLSSGLFNAQLGRCLMRKRGQVLSTFKYLTSLDLTYSWEEWRNWHHWRHACFDGHEYLRTLQTALLAAADLKELSIAFDCGIGRYAPPFHLPSWIFTDSKGKIHKWERLRSLRLAYLTKTEAWLVPFIGAHADTLRHLTLEQCNLDESFASQLAQVKGLQLQSLTIHEPDVPESALVSEVQLLSYVHHGARDPAGQPRDKTDEDLLSMNVLVQPLSHLSSGAGEAEDDWETEEELPQPPMPAPEGEELNYDSDYDPLFEFTAEAEEDWNSDDEGPPLLRNVPWDKGEAAQIRRGRFVTHSNHYKDVADNDSDDAADADDDDEDEDQASDHSSEWWSDSGSELEFIQPVEGTQFDDVRVTRSMYDSD